MSEMMDRDVGVGTGPGQEVLVEVQTLKKHYGGEGFFAAPPVKAVDGVSFDIRRGETLGLVGESGCGKSTLGRVLVQIEAATEGTISFDGTDVTTLTGDELKHWRPNAQIVFQDPESSLNDRMTVGSIIREPLDVHGWKNAAERRERVMDLLRQVGLQEDHYYRYPHQFSGGQRQRIGIARALALEPEFVVLDEPVSALDASVQARILNLLEDLQNEFDLTYLFIAHDLSVVRHICDRVAVMYLGKIMELGQTEELYTDPANPYTYSLLSAIPEPDPTADTKRITLSGTPPSPRDPPKGCQFTTRCPAKIRPDGFPEVSDATWEALERYREAIRERSRLGFTGRERLRRRIGMFSKFDDVDEAVADLFEPVEAPASVMDPVREAAELVKEGYPDRARDLLNEEFDSICDEERPELHVVGDGDRLSYCHRHEGGYATPADVIESRT
ncbi:MAG: oligopeptide/dipeptide ABC transporter ATP-binding protein [Haloarculaceae archaeon]